MQNSSTAKTWEKTRLQNLVRHKSKRYYARLFRDGKEIWKSLKTAHFSVAEARLAVVQKEHCALRSMEIDPVNAKMTFGQAVTFHMQRIEKNVGLKKRARKDWKDMLNALLKSWLGLADTEIKRLTPSACADWAAACAKVASSSRHNNTLSIFRHVIDLVIENGVLYTNPAGKLNRKPVRAKRLELPTLGSMRVVCRGVTDHPVQTLKSLR